MPPVARTTLPSGCADQVVVRDEPRWVWNSLPGFSMSGAAALGVGELDPVARAANGPRRWLITRVRLV